MQAFGGLPGWLGRWSRLCRSLPGRECYGSRSSLDESFPVASHSKALQLGHMILGLAPRSQRLCWMGRVNLEGACARVVSTWKAVRLVVVHRLVSTVVLQAVHCWSPHGAI